MLVALCYKCVKVGLISRELPETLPAVVLRIIDSHDHDARDTEAKQRAPLRWRCLLAVVGIVVLCATLASRCDPPEPFYLTVSPRPVVCLVNRGDGVA